MPITELLEKNCRLYGDEVCLVEINPELRERYKIMSVPCLIINKAKVAFGKKTLGQLLELLAEPEDGQTG